MTRIFLSHHKCATSWLADLLHDFYVERHGQAGFRSHFSADYPEHQTDYAYLLFTNSDWNYLRTRVPRAIHVIRNPLAIVVSSYFSHRNSHDDHGWPELTAQRARLQAASEAEGMLLTETFLSSTDGFYPGAIGPLAGLLGYDYDAPNLLTMRMEDLVAYPEVMLARAFAFFGEDMPAGIDAAIARHAFRIKSGGREPGQVNPLSHYRSGNPFDWTNHLSYDQASAMYGRHRAIIDRFYPEVARLFTS